MAYPRQSDCLESIAHDRSATDCRYDALHTALAEEVAVWLMQRYAFHRSFSPDRTTRGLLERLLVERVDAQIDSERMSQAIDRLYRAPCLLETAVSILQLEGSWPTESRTALLVYSEILVNILELAPLYEIPWHVTARITVNGGAERYQPEMAPMNR